ncbi:hypothetical protein FIU93_23010 [Labrenzia sp. THAF35]|uniref:hypothetical protein n=1 Tax=Labrenzia sp. THAF35 TaxID=2587854 RepID=UPI0012685957|nr:hypothetical protein [Labrenzia sp. THAF35]QFT69673.1 hypothetical protein FIU93_23010 [Labrenzia sp. THAF35]
MAKFKVGDRVRFTDQCHRGWWFGPHTEIKEGEVRFVEDDAVSLKYRVVCDDSDALVFVDDQHIEPEQGLLKRGDKVCISLDSKYLPGEIARIRDVDPDDPEETYFCEGTDRWWIAAKHVTPYIDASIVCLLEDGEPRPSVKPFVHASEESATKEAERLSLMHIGQEFGVFVLTEKRVAEAYEETVTKHRSVAA